MYKVEMFGSREVDRVKYSTEDLDCFSHCYDSCANEILSNLMTSFNEHQLFDIHVSVDKNYFYIGIETADRDFSVFCANMFGASADNYGIKYTLKINGIEQNHGVIIQ